MSDPRSQMLMTREAVRSERQRALLLLAIFGLAAFVIAIFAASDVDVLVMVTGKEGL